MFSTSYVLNFIQKNNCGIMFHHFHAEGSKPSFKGSISQKDLEKIINKIRIENIIGPREFIENIEKNKIENKCCITFDDGLKSQYNVALPVLKKYNIKAFWFIYTSIFDASTPDNEVFKFIFNKLYPNFSLFLNDFKNILKKKFPKKKFKFDGNYDNHIKFFSTNEREYRYLRDKILNKNEFNTIMTEILSKNKVNLSSLKKKIFLSKTEIKSLNHSGHYIGLHSHSHPTNMTKLKFKEQKKDYEKCLKKLSVLTKYKSKCMSHPNNFYNKNTLTALRELGVEVGFHSQDFNKKRSNLEIPRVDCVYLK